MTRKTITLPSGATCQVRRLSAFDLALETGKLPGIPGQMKPGEQPTKEQIEFGIRQTRIMLTRCVGPLKMPDGSLVKISGKPFSECLESEISIEEMDTNDVQALTTTITQLTIGESEAAKAATFPEIQIGSGGASSNGEALRKVADGTAANVAA